VLATRIFALHAFRSALTLCVGKLGNGDGSRMGAA
jgi:hypothetical protein